MAQNVSLTWTAASGASGYKLKARLKTASAYSITTDVGNVTTGVIAITASGDWCLTAVAYDGSGTEAAYSQELETTVRPFKLVLVGK